MELSNSMINNARLGMHYFPDTLHYSEKDLSTWLPQLKAMKMSWLTLLAPIERAIPENFVTGVVSSGIKVNLHFQLPAGLPVDMAELRLLFHNYARWGVKYVTLFDRPNCRSSWHPATWTQTDLVERFLDLFLPLAETARGEGLIPVFPPLEPGGDYWDLAFLQTALRSIHRRGYQRLLDVLVLGAYAWTNENPLQWGLGGPDRWTGARPYYTPPGEQDHLGFRIFDWYLAVARKEVEQRLPLLILAAGTRNRNLYQSGKPYFDAAKHAEINMEIARLMAGENHDVQDDIAVSQYVLACNFWLLAADQDSPYSSQAWFRSDAEHLPVVDAFIRWVAGRNKIQWDELKKETGMGEMTDQKQTLSKSSKSRHTINHYVLLPLYAWGAADWDLELIHPLMQKSHPTIGFSLAEARMAERVTVVGGEGAISNDALEMLRDSGCIVERIQADGTLIAT